MLKWRMHTKDSAYKRKEKIQAVAERNDFISVADAKKIAFELPDIEEEDETRGWRWSDLRGGSGMRVAMVDSDDKTQQYPYLYICDPTIMIHKIPSESRTNEKPVFHEEFKGESLNEKDRAYLDYLIEGISDAIRYSFVVNIVQEKEKCMVWKKSRKKDVVVEEWPCLCLGMMPNRIVKNNGETMDQTLFICQFQDGHVERINYDHIRFVEEWD